jgi:hypothetical protein
LYSCQLIVAASYSLIYRNYACIEVPLQKAVQEIVAMTNGQLFQDSTQMKLDVLSTMHSIAEAWRLITAIAIKNCLMKCGFLK